MGYAFRFLSADPALDLHFLDAALHARDERWHLDIDEVAGRAQLTCEGEVLADVEIGRRGEGVFDDEIETLREVVEALKDGHEIVAAGLQRSACMLYVRVVWGSRSEDDTLAALEGVWDVLFERVEDGLLYAESQGFHARERVFELT